MKTYNNKFYDTINELVSRADGNSAAKIVDHKTFIDEGAKFSALSQIEKDDYCNNFINNLVNKIQKTMDTADSYDGELKSVTKGELPVGGVVEIILHKWFNATQAGFVNLTDGNTNLDQWEIKKPECETYLFSKAVPFTLFYTINAIELEGAFKDESALTTFMGNVMTYFLNSKEQILTSIRRAIVADVAKDATAGVVPTSDTLNGQNYKLITMYNTINGLEGADAITVDDALYNTEFIRYAVSVMTKVAKRMGQPSVEFNSEGFKTFTSPNRLNKIILGDFVGAMDAYTIQDLRRPQSLGEFEELAFLESTKEPMTVACLDYDYMVASKPASITVNKIYYLTTDGKHYKGTAGNDWTEVTVSDEVKSAPIIGIFYDEYACGQFIERNSMRTTPLNARTETYNIFSNVQVLNYKLKSANSVVFTLA